MDIPLCGGIILSCTDESQLFFFDLNEEEGVVDLFEGVVTVKTKFRAMILSL